MKKNIYIIISLVLFLFLAFLVKFNYFYNIDIYVYGFIKSIINVKITPFIILITNLITILTYIIAIGSLILFLKHKKETHFKNITTNIILSIIIYQLLKLSLKIPRPKIMWLIDAKGHSFPSGHSYMSMFIYSLIILYNSKYLKGNIKIIVNCILVSLIILTGFSRIYLGVHYFSDVLAGFILGITHIIIVKNDLIK